MPPESGKRYTPGFKQETLALIAAGRPGTLSVQRICTALGVSRSGYYAHRHKPDGARRRQDQDLRGTVAECFKASRLTYGPPGLRMDLRALGHRVGRRRIARLIFDYSETFYNPRRRHSSLGYISPAHSNNRSDQEPTFHCPCFRVDITAAMSQLVSRTLKDAKSQKILKKYDKSLIPMTAPVH